MNNQSSPRQGTADLLKGIAVLLMIQVHLTEIFAQPAFRIGILGNISMFLGGPPVAPVFVAILGYFLGVTRRSFRGLILRGCALLGIAFLLNIGLNFHLLLKIHNGTFHLNPLEYLFGVDILFLAALSILILAVLRPLFKKFAVASVIATLLIVIVSPTVTDLLTVNSPARYALAFVGGNYTWSYFPLFPWLAYPLLGFTFSLYHQKLISIEWSKMVRPAGLIIAGGVIASTMRYAVQISANLESYYHHGLVFFLWTVLFIGFWLAALSLLHQNLGDRAVFLYVKWLGRNVTVAYACQWLIIGNLGTALYQTQSFPKLAAWFVAIVTAVSIATYFIQQYVDAWKIRRLHSS